MVDGKQVFLKKLRLALMDGIFSEFWVEYAVDVFLLFCMKDIIFETLF